MSVASMRIYRATFSVLQEEGAEGEADEAEGKAEIKTAKIKRKTEEKRKLN